MLIMHWVHREDPLVRYIIAIAAQVLQAIGALHFVEVE
jgi:hypothetical protein